MIKTKIVETTEEFNENGKVIKRITRTETIEDDTIYYSPNGTISDHGESSIKEGELKDV